MVMENDKLEIPEEYMTMPLEELRAKEDEKLRQILADREKGIGKKIKKPECDLIVNW